MNVTQPIKSQDELDKLKKYYQKVKPNMRNYLLIILLLNTALRVSDALTLKWKDVWNAETNHVHTHLIVREKKTQKLSNIYINQNVAAAILDYLDNWKQSKESWSMESYLFISQKGKKQPISRIQAFRIIHNAAEECGIEGSISSHSLRKTFGFYAWKQGISPALLMSIYNHSSYTVTKRYLGIEQADRDEVFQNILL